MNITIKPNKFPICILSRSNIYVIKTKEMLSTLRIGTFWHKFIIHKAANYDKVHVLRAVLNMVARKCVPLHIRTEGENLEFIAQCSDVGIVNLCNNNLVVKCPEAQKSFPVTVVIGYGGELSSVDFSLFMKNTIMKRFDESTQTLSLEDFRNDPDFGDQIFCDLQQIPILKMVLKICRIVPATKLKLGQNELRSLYGIDASVTSLDLTGNEINDFCGLSSLKYLVNLTEICLDGNPICELYDAGEYVQRIKKIVPTLQILDGISLLNLEKDTENFAVSDNATSIADQFLEHFFVLYDSDNRSCLHALYHSNAIFSLSSTLLLGQSTTYLSKLTLYEKISNNLLWNRKNLHYDIGADNIISAFNLLPLTKHDPHSFSVNVTQPTDSYLLLVVSGVFRETETSDTNCVYSFTRTFLLVSGNNGEYNVLNEMLHVSNAPSYMVERAFTIDTGPKSTLLRTMPKPNTYSEQDLVAALYSEVTTLNLDMARLFLETLDWDIKAAFRIFLHLYKNDKISNIAFIKDMCQWNKSNLFIRLRIKKYLTKIVKASKVYDVINNTLT